MKKPMILVMALLLVKMTTTQANAPFASSTSVNNFSPRNTAIGTATRDWSDPTLEVNLWGKAPDRSEFLADGFMQNFNNTYSTAVDNMDVRKMMNAVDNISVVNGSFFLIVERRPIYTLTDTLRISLTNTRIDSYRLEVVPTNFATSPVRAFLKDKYLNTEIPMDVENAVSYEFAITSNPASKATDRFVVYFKANNYLVLPVAFTGISAQRQSGDVLVQWNTATETNIHHYEIQRSIDGNMFFSVGNKSATNNAGNGAAYNFKDPAALKADIFYRIKAVSPDGKIQYSSIAKVKAEAGETTVSVYPNPVSDKTIHLFLTGTEKGNTAIQILSTAGQVVYKGTLMIQSTSLQKDIMLNKNTPSGDYILLLVNEKGEKHSTHIMVL